MLFSAIPHKMRERWCKKCRADNVNFRKTRKSTVCREIPLKNKHVIWEHKCYFRTFLTKWSKGDVKSAGLTMEISRKTRKSTVCREIPLKSKLAFAVGLWQKANMSLEGRKFPFGLFVTIWGKCVLYSGFPPKQKPDISEHKWSLLIYNG
jgi:hypothetical protein